MRAATDIRIIQVLLGHANLSTTARYAQVATNLIAATTSPLDRLTLEVTPPSDRRASRPVLEVADIFRRHGDAYRATHAGRLGRVQRRVMSAIETCRTAALGGHVEHCEDCGAIRVAYNSCRNRHCPKCQGLAREPWLADRHAELLPVPYFHVVFTLPPAVAAIAFQNKAVVYDILFRTAAETLMTIAADPKHLGAEIGLIAVLHTWGQTLTHHPHVHCVVPGGGLSPDGQRWIACRPSFFLPVQVLSRLFRRLFLAALRGGIPDGGLRFFGDSRRSPSRRLRRPPRRSAPSDWVVYAKPPFGGPEQVLDYLARYTHRVAIANSRLVAHRRRTRSPSAGRIIATTTSAR